LPVLTFIAGLCAWLAVAWFARSFLGSVSGAALNANAEQFLHLANENLEKRTSAIDDMVKPVALKLDALNNAIQQMSGTDKNLSDQIVNLQKETAKIAGALNNPRERGRSAEILLE